MTSSETGWRRLIVRWTAPRSFAAIILFLLLAIVLEVLLIYSFQMFGLMDSNLWSTTFIVPGVNWSFAVSVSLLFHILPLSVMAVLLASWVYLTKYTAFVPRGVEQARRVPPPTRRAQEGRKFKTLRRFFRRLSRSLQRIGKTLKNGFLRIYGVSYISERLSFTKTAVRSAITVFVVFVATVLLVIVVEYPDLIRVLALSLYKGNPSLRDFVIGVTQWLHGLGQAVPPLGGLGSAINQALVGAGPGIRHALYDAGSAFSTPFVRLDVAGKYVLSQNFAAWTAALVALLYGSYVSSRLSRRPRAAKR